jgi:hypothetical protein
MTESLNLKQTNEHLAAELQLHMQMTRSHTSSTPRSLQKTPDNYLVLSSIGFNKASVSTLMVGT